MNDPGESWLSAACAFLCMLAALASLGLVLALIGAAG